MELEKGFKVKYSNDIEFPERPKVIGNITSLGTIYTPHTILKEPNVKYQKIDHIERARNDVWLIQNRVGKIKHNETEFLYPLMLWIPEYPSTVNLKRSSSGATRKVEYFAKAVFPSQSSKSTLSS